jgi:hypothetical protein
MTDVPFATVSDDATARPLHPSRLCRPRRHDTLFAAAHLVAYWPKADVQKPPINVRLSG